MHQNVREALENVLNDTLESFLSEYEDTDDNDLFFDVVMKFFGKKFGLGEVIEYIATDLMASKSEAKNRYGEHLLDMVDEYPE